MRRRIGVITVCAGLALVVAMVRLLAPVPLEVLDRKLLDFRYLVRGPLVASSHVVIVGIDEASLAEIGRWPWPRARLAQLIDRLHDAGVRAIGLDIVLDEPATSVDRAELETALAANPHRTAEELRRALHAELDDDAQLATALRRAGDVVLRRGERWRPYRTIASWYLWRAFERAGHATTNKIRPPKVRRKRS